MLFPCGDASLAGVLHPGQHSTGILFVAGGRQTRVGPHRLFVELAEMLSAAGYPSLRFDRRGVGDSEGDDGGFEAAGDDIAAAAAALRTACPHVETVAGLGLCDGAAALLLHGRAAGVGPVVLLNCWSSDPGEGAAPPPKAVRQRYLERLLSAGAWRRLVAGDVDVVGALRGLLATRQAPAAGALGKRLAAAIAAHQAPILALQSSRDRTAQLFQPIAESAGAAIEIATLPGADHTLTLPEDRAAAFAATCRFLATAAA
jgi:exosortase A-associated hydrolase 1